MPEKILVVDISGLKHVRNLCRVCLTEGKNMLSLYDNLHNPIFGTELTTIFSALEKFSQKPLFNDERYPSFICSMCHSLMNIAYKFVYQLKVSQKQLAGYFKEDSRSQEVAQKQNVNVASVEIISKMGKYSLSDLIIIEEDNKSSESKFEGFLKNLGVTVTAEYVRNYNRIKNIQKENEKPIVRIIPLLKKSERVKEVKLENKIEEEKAEIQIISANNNQSIKYRRRKTLNKSDLTCTKCNRIFREIKFLNKHYKEVHLRVNSFLCQVCGHMAHTKSSLKNHMRHHGKKIQCSTCGRKYLSKTALMQHERVHINERLYLCTVCGKSFIYSSALTYHMRIHTGERKYKCTYCPRMFAMQCALSRHLRIHTGIRPYRCRFCNKGFRSTSELKCHEMIHTGLRPHSCKVCGKGYIKTYNLKVHMLGHPGPYICEFCQRGFTEAQYLNMHIKISHGIKNYELNSSTVYYLSDLEGLDDNVEYLQCESIEEINNE